MHIRKLRNRVGMFSNINNIIRHCIYQDKFEKPIFYVKWYNDSYQTNRYNLWEKYFEQPYFNKGDKEYNYSNVKQLPKIREELPRYIMPLKNKIIYEPIDREYIYKIIKKRIKFKKFLIEKRDNYIKKFKNKYLIGLHIRGSGGTANGTKEYRRKLKLINKIPIPEFEFYLNKKINELKEKYIKYEIFLFTDNNFVLNYFKNKYNINYFNSQRSEHHQGEIHLKEYNFNKEKLAEEILFEVLVMSKLNYYIHGLSNISNFVLCNNPKLENINIFNKFFFN